MPSTVSLTSALPQCAIMPHPDSDEYHPIFAGAPSGDIASGNPPSPSHCDISGTRRPVQVRPAAINADTREHKARAGEDTESITRESLLRERLTASWLHLFLGRTSYRELDPPATPSFGAPDGGTPTEDFRCAPRWTSVLQAMHEITGSLGKGYKSARILLERRRQAPWRTCRPRPLFRTLPHSPVLHPRRFPRRIPERPKRGAQDFIITITGVLSSVSVISRIVPAAVGYA